jgi:hypothetical protein
LLAAGAKPLRENGFKVDLVKHSVVRTLWRAVGLPATVTPGERS